MNTIYGLDFNIKNSKIRFSLHKDAVEKLNNESYKFGFTDSNFGEIVFYRTYSRAKANGLKETWPETVVRVINGVLTIRKWWFKLHNLRWVDDEMQKVAFDMAMSMLKMHWLPPGRGIQNMGSDYVYERGSASLYNCAFVKVEDLAEDCAWIMDMLMSGVGVGFEVINKDFRMYLQNKKRVWNYEIPDSKEGWVESTRDLIRSYRHPNSSIINFDYSKIRPFGTPIKGFGGTASGPEPLMELHDRIRVFCEEYISGQINSVRLTADIVNCIGVCVVAGNVRRSAEIAIGAPTDDTFLNLKNYSLNPDRAPYGWMSNNTVRLSEKDHFDMIPQITERIIDNGEPGIMNLINVQKYGRYGQESPDLATGLNPCFTGDTLVMLANGTSVPIKDLVGKEEFYTFSYDLENKKPVIGRGHSARLTGSSRLVYEVTLDNGTSVKCTGDHKWLLNSGEYKEAKDLSVNDSLMPIYRRLNEGRWKGYSEIRSKESWYLEHWLSDEYNLESGKYTTETGSVRHHKDFDQFNNDPSNIIRMTWIDHQNLHRKETSKRQLRLAKEGKHTSQRPEFSIKKRNSELKKVREGTHWFLSDRNKKKCSERAEQRNTTMFSNGSHPFLNNENQKKANLSANHKRHHLNKGIYNPECEPCILSHPMNHKVVSVEFCGYEDVYDITVDKYHNFTIDVDHGIKLSSGVIVHNCGEIPLESNEVCNLAEVFPTRCSSKEEFMLAIKAATLYSSTVSLYPTHSVRTNEVVARNRRIGVSISGISEWMDTYKTNVCVRWMKDAYRVVKDYNQSLATQAGVVPSVRLTTVKPSGSISQLVGVPSGMHFPIFKHAIRRIIVSTTSPIFEKLIVAGYEHEPVIKSLRADEFNSDTHKVFSKYSSKDSSYIHTEDSGSYVFEVPIYSGMAREAKRVSSWEQFSILSTLQRDWADNSVSATINFDRDTEANQLNHQLSQFIPVIKSVSILPHSDKGEYNQMPYEGITEEEYKKRVSRITPIDWKSLKDDSAIQEEKFCTNDSCSI